MINTDWLDRLLIQYEMTIVKQNEAREALMTKSQELIDKNKNILQPTNESEVEAVFDFKNIFRGMIFVYLSLNINERLTLNQYAETNHNECILTYLGLSRLTSLISYFRCFCCIFFFCFS